MRKNLFRSMAMGQKPVNEKIIMFRPASMGSANQYLLTKRPRQIPARTPIPAISQIILSSYHL